MLLCITKNANNPGDVFRDSGYMISPFEFLINLKSEVFYITYKFDIFRTYPKLRLWGFMGAYLA